MTERVETTPSPQRVEMTRIVETTGTWKQQKSRNHKVTTKGGNVRVTIQLSLITLKKIQ